jgi:hypothetical protein
MRILLAAVLSVLLSPGLCPGQAWRSYTNLNPVRALLADGRILWAATEGGVFSFSAADTVRLGAYTNVDGLPSTDVRAAALDQRRRLYFGTAASGAAVLDSARSRFTLICSRDQNIISDSINAVLCHGDYVFLGSPGGLSFFDGQVWRSFSNRVYPMGPNVLSLAWRNDSLFVGTDRGLSVSPLAGLAGPNYSLWFRYSNAGIGDSSVHSLLAADTAVLAGTGRGVSRLAISSWTEMLNLGRQVRGILSFRDTLRLATGNGVWSFAGGSAAEASAGLPSLNVRTLSLDSDSSLWAGTANGLARWDGTAWHPFQQDCLPSNNVNRVAAGKDGSVWLAHGGEFASRIGPEGSVAVHQNPFPGIPLTALTVDDSGYAWYGLAWGDASGRSCFRISPEGEDTVFGLPLLPPMCGVYDIVREGGNRLFFAMRYHNVPNYVVKRWPDGSYQWINDPNPPGTYLKPMALAVDASSALWVGTLELGLFRYDFGTGGWANLRKEGGLSENNVTDLAVDPTNAVWASTNGGLNRCLYDPAGDLLKVEALYTSANSQLLGDNVRSVALDRSGNRWIATDRGLSVLSWDGKWDGFTSGDALANGSRLLSDDVKSVAVRPRDQSGDDILIATSRGLSVYRHQSQAGQAPASAHAAPNPFRPDHDRFLMLSKLPDRAAVSLHTLDGRRLASWQGPSAPAHSLLVDPAAALSGGLPSGLYLIAVRPPSGKTQVIKLAVLR